LFGDGDEGVEAFVVAGAVEIEAEGFAVAGKGVAVGAGVEIAHDGVALGVGDAADLPLNERDGGGRERGDGAVVPSGDHEGNVAIEEERIDAIGGCGDVDLGGGDGSF
jgi:NADPH-dependent 2,4-dienoyl-CoA reductase/sulfur reductase-like enzyme